MAQHHEFRLPVTHASINCVLLNAEGLCGDFNDSCTHNCFICYDPGMNFADVLGTVNLLISKHGEYLVLSNADCGC